MKLEPHAAVLAQDLPAIYSFIAKADPNAAERVLDAVERTFETIAHQAVSGVRYSTRNPLLKNVRMLPVHDFPNYLVFYRIEGTAIQVLYVVHGARDLPRLFRSEPRG